MEVLGEIFIWIVGGIAEMIGGTVAENISDKAKNSVKGVVIAVIIGLVTWRLLPHSALRHIIYSQRTWQLRALPSGWRHSS